MTDDVNKSKYATVRSRDQGEKSGKKDKYEDADLLGEKDTKRIFELGKEQMEEIEMEEQKEMEMKRRKGGRGSADADADSSDEEDNGSTMGDVIDDDEE